MDNWQRSFQLQYQDQPKLAEPNLEDGMTTPLSYSGEDAKALAIAEICCKEKNGFLAYWEWIPRVHS